MKIATIKTGKLDTVKEALVARDSWSAYIAESLQEGENLVSDDMGETLADVALSVCGLYVVDAEGW